MKKLIKREKLMAEINITPFTDVVLVLLIIFMITTPMLVHSGLKLELPKAEKAETNPEKNIEIQIDKEGRIFAGSAQVTLAQLKERITARLLENPDTPVVINGDKNVRYNDVIEVIDASRESGAKRFALSVEQKNSKLKE